jgi:hypothetical protein
LFVKELLNKNGYEFENLIRIKMFL